jgi:hypothetical protein
VVIVVNGWEFHDEEAFDDWVESWGRKLLEEFG